jgi:hypothetical protein
MEAKMHGFGTKITCHEGFTLNQMTNRDEHQQSGFTLIEVLR